MWVGGGGVRFCFVLKVFEEKQNKTITKTKQTLTTRNTFDFLFMFDLVNRFSASPIHADFRVTYHISKHVL